MTSTDVRVSALQLQIKHSRAEAQRIIRDFQGLRRSVEDMQKTAARAINTRSVDSLRSAVDRANKEVQEGVGFWQQYAQAKRAALEPLPDDFQVGDRARRQISSRLSGLGREVRALPAINIPGAGSLTTDAIGKVTAALAGLPPVAGPVLVALAGLGAAFVALEASTAAVKKTLNEAVASVTFYYQETRRLTTEQNRQRLAELQTQLENEQAERQRFMEAFGDLWDPNVIRGSALQKFLAQIDTADDAAAARVAELNQSIPTLEGQVAALNRAIDDGTAATNDRIAAEQALIEAQQKFVDHQIQNEIRVLTNIPKTTEALNARLEAINREQEVLNEYLNTAGISAELTAELRQQLADLGSEESLLAIRVAPLVSEIEAAAAAAEVAADKEKLLADDRRRAAQEAAKVAAEIEQTQDKIDKLTTDSAAKIAGLTEDLNEKLTDALRDKDSAIAKADQEAAKDRLGAQADANDALEEAEAEHRKNLLKIARDYFRSQAEAVQDRDAVAADRAAQAAEDALADEKEGYDERKKAIDAQLRKQNAAIDARLREQTANAIARYTEQTRIANEHHRKAVEAERARADAEIAANQQRINALQQQMIGFNLAANGIAKEGSNAVLATHKAFWQAALGLAQGAASSGEAVKGKVPKYDSGPPVTFTRRQMVSVTKGDVLIPPGNRQQMNANFYLTGVSRAQLHRELDRKFDEFLDEAEVD